MQWCIFCSKVVVCFVYSILFMKGVVLMSYFLFEFFKRYFVFRFFLMQYNYENINSVGMIWNGVVFYKLKKMIFYINLQFFCVWSFENQD